MIKEKMEYMLTEISQRVESVDKELSLKPEGRLMISTRKGKCDFIQVTRQNGVRKRRWINKQQMIVKDLCRKRYLEEELAILEKNYEALENFLRNYTEIEPEKIIGDMPEPFRQMPLEYFFRDRMDRSWTEEVKKWMEEPFEQSAYDPDAKDKTTSSGLKVRSKSEVIIAEKLDQYGIPYRYEQMLYIDNYAFSPDFTILTRNGIKYWEHAGMVNVSGYIRKHNWKMTMYQRAGIVPWKNLITTYDDMSGGIDNRIIDSEIINKLL